MENIQALQRGFKGMWIPAFIWDMKEYSWSERLLLLEIDSLDNEPEKGCWASNEWLANFLGSGSGKITAATVANMISKLRKDGVVMDVFSDGKNRGLRSLIHRNPDGSDRFAPAAKTPKAKVAKPQAEALHDPDKSTLIAETEKLLGLSIDIFTQERINAGVPERFTEQWLDLVGDKLIGNIDVDQNYLKKQLGHWLQDFKRNLWRYEKDAEKTAPAQAPNMQAAAGKRCDECRETNGMVWVTVAGEDRLTKCGHKKAKAA